jgi:DNA helicase-2/ATP-dependent DNA helicase PcrA
MAKERLKLEPEVQEVFKCIDQNENFLLSGGAGSGKTYSLVQTIRQVVAENPASRLACITYTNAAVREITERIGHGNLKVSTIHDFLWDNIKQFQKELRSTLVALANDPLIDTFKIDGLAPVPTDFFDNHEDGIQYKEYFLLAKGIISHDELLLMAERMFATYPKLCDVTKDKFRFIFVDEYQDTSKSVVRILLDHLKQSSRKCVIGFFGDAMQSIYDDGVGNLDAYKAAGLVKEIKKEQNRRNPRAVIDLANQLRNDGIVQVPSKDPSAPNMSASGQIKPGAVKFLYSENPDLQRVRDYLVHELGWNFADAKQTKELNLTHNLIADKAGFRGLMEIYDADRILQYKQTIAKEIKGKGLELAPDFTFGELIDMLNLKPTPVVEKFIAENDALYQQARKYRYADFKKVYADKDMLLDDKKHDEEDESRPSSKRDNLIRHLFKIQKCVSLYEKAQHNEFMRITDFKVRCVKDKLKLRDNVDALKNVGGKTIGEVIELASAAGICLIDDKLANFKSENEYIYLRVEKVQYSEFQNLFNYLEGHSPFSTQHKTKGAEFPNVLVILDNGKWNKYNFEYLFIGKGTAQVLERTQKIFYVCCTRSMESLAVFYHKPSKEVVSKAENLFGSENVVSLPA